MSLNMLVTDITLSGNSPESEIIRFFAHNLDTDNGINSSALDILTDQVYSENLFIDAMQEVQPFAISTRLTKDNAVKLMGNLCNDEKYKDNSFYINKAEGYHIVANGKRSSLKFLPAIFSKNYSNSLSPISLVKKQVKFPFSMIKAPGEYSHHYVTRQLTKDEFCQLKTYGLDIEGLFWWKDLSLENLPNSDAKLKEFLIKNAGFEEKNITRLNHNDLVTLVEDHFNENLGNHEMDYHKQPLSIQLSEMVNGTPHVHYFEHLSGSNQTIECDTNFGKAKLHEHKSKNARNMFAEFQDYMDSAPPLIVVTVNGMSYDFKELKDYAKRQIKFEKEKSGKSDMPHFSIQGVEPIIESKAGFFDKVVTHSCYHIDLSPFSQHYLPFTIDNGYVTILPFFMGKKISKLQTYDDQVRDALAELIDPEMRSEENIAYAIEDTIPLVQIKDTLLPAVYYLSRLFEVNPESICATSKKRLGVKGYEMKHFLLKKEAYHMNRSKRILYDKFSTSDAFHKLLDVDTNKLLSKSVKPDFAEGTLYYMHPFYSFFENKINNPTILEMNNYVKSFKIQDKESSTAYTLLRFIFRYALEEGYFAPYIFEHELSDYNKLNMKNYVSDYQSFLHKFTPTNRNGNIYCFSGDVSDDTEFLNIVNRFGIRLADGDLLNIDKGSFVLNDGVSLYKRGFDTKAKGGFKSILEKGLLVSTLESIFSDGADKTIEYLAKEFKQIRTGNFPKDLLFYNVNSVGKDYWNYSSYAQRQERFKAYVDAGVMKGTKFNSVRLEEGWFDEPSFNDMKISDIYTNKNIAFIYDRLLGPEDKNGERKLKEGIVGRLLVPLIEDHAISKENILNYIEKGNPL